MRMLTGSLVWVLAVVAGCSGSCGIAAPRTPPNTATNAATPPRGLPTAFMRGITLSCPTWGPIWGRPETGHAMDDIRTLGANWVAIHPYATVRKDGAVQFAPSSTTAFLPRAAAMAKERNLSLLYKPHLAYWGSFSWRGTIQFDASDPVVSAAQWSRFFSDYTAFIVDQAKMAEEVGAGMFVVGLEYEATVHHEAQWRAVIAAVREVYFGPITYAANWDGVTKVPFWDAVDVIGVQMYFPMSRTGQLDDATLDAGWNDAMQTLNALASRYQKPLLFAEIGYAAHPEVASAPWKPGNDDSARPLRAKLIKRALDKMEREPHVLGAFWWKWMPGEASRHDADFSMKDPEARAAVGAAWSGTTPPPRATLSRATRGSEEKHSEGTRLQGTRSGATSLPP